MTSAMVTRDDVFSVLAELAAAQEKLAALPVDGLSAREVLDVLEVRQQLVWADAAVDHKLVARLGSLAPKRWVGTRSPKS